MADQEVVLRLDGLDKTFTSARGLLSRGSTTHAVDDVDLEVRRGETLALVGESGSGKSTVARMALRLLDADAGTITFAGQDITHLSARRMRPLRREMAMVFQDPYASLNPRQRVGQTIRNVLANFDLPRSDERIAELMVQVGLDPRFATRYPHEFSGGQRQRIGIARALASQPRLLVADEPVSALDVSVRAQILNLLTDLRDQHQLAVLLISHDLAVVKTVADRVAVMREGRIVEQGSVEQVYMHPRGDYTRALLAAVPVPDPGRRRRRTLAVAETAQIPGDGVDRVER